MWNRLRSRIGGRGIAIGVVAVVAVVVAAVLVLGSGDEETPVGSQAAATTGTDGPDDAESAKKDAGKKGSKKRPEPSGSPAPEPGADAEQFAAFQDCVRDNGGKPIDLSEPAEQEGDEPGEAEGPEGDDDLPPALQDYSFAEIEALQKARAACIDQLPPELRERAQARAAAVEDSPFRACIASEQALGRDISDAVAACEDEIPESERDELPPGFGEGGPFGPGGAGPAG